MENTLTTELQIEHALDLNDRVHGIETALDAAPTSSIAGMQFVHDDVERVLPELRKNLKQIILRVVRENLQPEDKAALQELFSRVRKIVAEERGQIMAHLAEQKHSALARRNTEFARGRQMLVELNQFERLAAEYEAAIGAMFGESESGIERVQF
jgi:hypothetical protein